MNTDNTVADLLSFLDKSPTASWAVSGIASKLEENGFRRLHEKDMWNLSINEKFYIVRSSSAIMAGVSGSQPCGEAGCRIIGAHTDSPGFRVKPEAQRSKDGMITLGVEVYGSPILATWFDRDLSIAGTLVFQEENLLKRRLFMLRKPVCRIASPAIHLERNVNKDGFKVNPEENTPLLLSTSGSGFQDLLALACESAGLREEDVSGWSMEVWDPQPAVTGGINDDFIFSGRLDNLTMCHAAVEAILRTEETPHMRMISLFNSEEVGSKTLNGANSSFLDSVIERLSESREEYFRCLSNSIQVSADGAHGVHPNYPGKHDSECRPVLNGGPVIKVNASNRYSSSDISKAYFSACASAAGVNVQYFVNRNDILCGTTIGPITSTRTGINSVDVGSAMLSMHSVREMTGASDQEDMIKAFVEHMIGSVSISD
ncbi:MAG: M18 family aminopeptidase [Candidatus Aegiribacteria sp.]|nr:M18 family aminopeptidase [Candidatus Aegiribacteria sp.]